MQHRLECSEQLQMSTAYRLFFQLPQRSNTWRSTFDTLHDSSVVSQLLRGTVGYSDVSLRSSTLIHFLY